MVEHGVTGKSQTGPALSADAAASASVDIGHQAPKARRRADHNPAGWITPDPRIESIVPELNRRGVRRILDLGCGVGRHALMFAEAGFDVSGLDASKAGLAFCGQMAEERGVELNLKAGSMTRLPYDPNTFDYVLAFNVIYHGNRRVVARAVREITRVLKPYGLLQAILLSKRHGDYTQGVEIAPNTFVRDGKGDKAHPHFYCNAAEAVRLLKGYELLRLEDAPQKDAQDWRWYALAERVG